MKFYLIPLLLITHICAAQGWQAEVMIGASGYTGDLTQKLIPLNALKPAVNVNIKYNLNNLVIIRAGVGWLNVEGNDKYNKQPDLKNRRLNFKSTVWEASLCAELNLAEADLFYSYPYIFAGVGVFHFNPYTFDTDNKKTYLQPLGTEGQGITGYPNRKPYSLTQFCLPVGIGWKYKLTKRYDIGYELGYRLLFTDYLDDVSTTYVSSRILQANKGAKTAELAYRQKTIPDSDLPHNGQTRGNPKINDGYFFSGIKIIVHLSQDKEK